MKKYLFLTLLIMSALGLSAQAVQDGIIKEYNEKNAKTPLSGVELNVRSAGSTVSDTDGEFSLRFLTLKPGEKVNVRRIEKLGYELFNKEAIEQWNINPTTPFVIVMCRADRFKKIRDNYERVSSASYERQLKKEQAQLARLKEEGRLKEDEYNRQLAELNENYEKQLDKLENYVDRFSRIDLSELSATESEIIALVQDGRIDEAIERYDRQGYVDKYTREVSQLKEVSAAIDRLEDVKFAKEQSRDSLLAAINRQVETLRLAGGRENFNKIGVILHDVAYADTTDVAAVSKYIRFLRDQNLFQAMDTVTNTYLSLDLSPDAKLQGYEYKLQSLMNLMRYQECMDLISEIDQEIERYGVESLDRSVLAHLYFRIGGVFSETHKNPNALQYFVKANTILDGWDGIMDAGMAFFMMSVKEGIVYNYVKIGEKDKAVEILSSTYAFYKSLDIDMTGYEIVAAKNLVDLAQLHEQATFVDESREVLDITDKLLQAKKDINPRAVLPIMSTLYMAKGNLAYKLKDWDDCEYNYLKALEIYSDLQNVNKRKYIVYCRKVYNNLALLYLKKENKDKAFEMSSKSYDIAKQCFDAEPGFYAGEFANACVSMGRVAETIGNMEVAEEKFKMANQIEARKLEEIGDTYRENYWTSALDLALLYVNNENHEKGVPFLKHVVEFGQNFIEKGTRLYSPLQSLKYFLGQSYRRIGEFDAARNVMESFVADNPDKPLGYLELARIRLNTNDRDGARTSLKKCLELSPNMLNNADDADVLMSLLDSDE